MLVRGSYLLFTCICALVFTFATTYSSKASYKSTRIDTNQQSHGRNATQSIINDNVAARLDASGMQIAGNTGYGGALTDVGGKRKDGGHD